MSVQLAEHTGYRHHPVHQYIQHPEHTFLWIFLCDVSNIKDQSYQDFGSNLFNCQTNFLAFFNSSPFTFTSANVLNKSKGNFQQSPEIWDEHAADGYLTHIYGGQQENSNISIWEKYFLNTNFFHASLFYGVL